VTSRKTVASLASVGHTHKATRRHRHRAVRHRPHRRRHA
jgi:hypothetical protein